MRYFWNWAGYYFFFYCSFCNEKDDNFFIKSLKVWNFSYSYLRYDGFFKPFYSFFLVRYVKRMFFFVEKIFMCPVINPLYLNIMEWYLKLEWYNKERINDNELSLNVKILLNGNE